MVSRGDWSKGAGEKEKIQEKDMWETQSKEGWKQMMDDIA